VLKSTQASALEGSIGGTVNLRTASAFDTPGFHGGVHAEGDDNTMSELRGSKFSAFVGDTNDGGRWILARRRAFGHQESHRLAQRL